MTSDPRLMPDTLAALTAPPDCTHPALAAATTVSFSAFAESPSSGDDVMAAFRLRQAYTARFGFVLPTPELPHVLAPFAPFVEIGAGTGALTRYLIDAGLDVVATDPAPCGPTYFADAPRWTDIHEMDAAAALAAYPDRAVLLSWPCYARPWAEQALDLMSPGTVVALIGEGPGGCTGTDGMFARLEAAFTRLDIPEADSAIRTFPGIHDRLTLHRKIAA